MLIAIQVLLLEIFYIKCVINSFPLTGVDLRSSKVCELGLFNYKAKHVFYPFEKSKFRCRYDYYWASIFKVCTILSVYTCFFSACGLLLKIVSELFEKSTTNGNLCAFIDFLYLCGTSSPKDCSIIVYV